jgi:serine/threonine protein kinase
MHRDIKLENILLNYETDKDKKDLNLMKAQIKIIDFGFACKIQKNALTYTAIGNPINMDPLILKKLTKGKKARQLGYDQKADIWSLGAICYEMLIGRAAFDAEDMDDLVNKIEAGKYKVPTSLSKEVVSFLNGMLQYDPNARLTIDQLAEHQFITKNVKDFKPIDVRQVSNKLDKNEIVIDVKKNKSIWAIFNQEDEQKLMGISPGNLRPINEQKAVNPRTHSQDKKINNNAQEDDNPIRQANTFKIKNVNMNNILYNQNLNNYNYNNINPNFQGPILPSAFQAIPGNPFNPFPMPQFQGSMFPNVPTTESNYSFSGGIYGNP